MSSMLLQTPDYPSRTFFNPQTRVVPEFTIPYGIRKSSHPLVQPVSASILWSNQSILDRYFLPLSRRNRSSPLSWVQCLLPKVNTHPVKTIFILNPDNGNVDGLTTPISNILSTSFCSSSLMAYGK